MGTPRLTEAQRWRLLKAAVWLVSLRNTETRLSSIVTGHDKLVLYASIQRKRSWCSPVEHPKTIASPEFHTKKVVLIVLQDSKAAFLFQLLPPTSLSLHSPTVNHRIVWPARLKASPRTTGPSTSSTKVPDHTSQTLRARAD